MFTFPTYTQLDAMDCGPTCLRMIAKHYGRHYSLETLRQQSFITREGVSMLGISDAAEHIGFRTSGVMISFEQLVNDAPLPCIVHWKQNHFVVVYNIKKDKRVGHRIYVADPALGLVTYDEADFKKCWHSTKKDEEEKGTALLLEPGPEFFDRDDEKENRTRSLRYFLRYLTPYKSQLVQLVLGMLVVSILQLIFPFLTQSLVDVGIRDGNLSFITLILIAQLIISVARLSVEFIRSWILLHMNTRINIALISDFLAKLMKLPLRYFDTKMTGDIMQRIGDHGRIESFLTGNSISTLFSFVNFFVFAFVLAYYNLVILGIFLAGNAFYVAWILFFMKYRRELDHKRFAQSAGEQSNIIQLITGMQEIKLNNCEKQKRWQWERIQVKLFKIGIKGLILGQLQQVGSVFFSQTTNIIVSFIAAKAVVDGQMTLGMMMSLTYIIGQLSSPIEQFIGFARSFQDAQISLERLNEVHGKEDEEETIENKLTVLPDKRNISIENLSFSYDGADRDYVLDDINLTIPQEKVTAIVGASGSGKTTLIKLMLGFYEPNKGNIKIGETPLSVINPHLWRSKSGSVMQDGFIFSETIAQNIGVGDDHVDIEKLRHAVTVANIRDFIDGLPLGYNTKIGMEGNGISQGQRQRILIARAVYKNPEFIFLDEATNALDANNEKEIMQHLHGFYQGKTVVVVAHRLSTVKDADKIVVLDQGKVAEEGTHEELTALKGKYYELVKNQLELGK
ncbi:MAG: peptidase domain-containing ABC transporter [Bacteroidales bacterium]|jgi:ATP-binding cassette subfamily B protein|nr:peptidase domain-containing ABC transporter [Bacteroidales bacterium]MDD2771238.1 peptidase domain-containing ABC transporter [Bacteroidales bacterium]MDD3105087.1 peptidase domain-containing ABC transporter [Bacteroidales bacterium]MDD3549929.1 peptidase domain-containing ABC transporter [Bacteroidales bacterium]MDY0182308.1 peptidase domain-containing ABC transporter [Proteiniphilum sp.]